MSSLRTSLFLVTAPEALIGGSLASHTRSRSGSGSAFHTSTSRKASSRASLPRCATTSAWNPRPFHSLLKSSSPNPRSRSYSSTTMTALSMEPMRVAWKPRPSQMRMHSRSVSLSTRNVRSSAWPGGAGCSAHSRRRRSRGCHLQRSACLRRCTSSAFAIAASLGRPLPTYHFQRVSSLFCSTAACCWMTWAACRVPSSSTGIPMRS
mmetsp:Transcript_10074/g.26807  ORF Transcript_10074/g.26807 Transcript_10074/m.26807 type:complete len:207 (-) Transcript_10074:21-641(-)